MLRAQKLFKLPRHEKYTALTREKNPRGMKNIDFLYRRAPGSRKQLPSFSHIAARVVCGWLLYHILQERGKFAYFIGKQTQKSHWLSLRHSYIDARTSHIHVYFVGRRKNGQEPSGDFSPCAHRRGQCNCPRVTHTTIAALYMSVPIPVMV